MPGLEQASRNEFALPSMLAPGLSDTGCQKLPGMKGDQQRLNCPREPIKTGKSKLITHFGADGMRHLQSVVFAIDQRLSVSAGEAAPVCRT
jgi:hypothetical protein